VLGQQVLMGRMSLPAEVLTWISMLENPQRYGMTEAQLQAQINTSLAELVALKTRKLQGETLTGEEEKRLSLVIPYNLDAWDGYFAERETVLGTAKAYGKNLVVLAGDTHNAWANNLKDMQGEAVGVEFATSSVSSPGLEEYLSLSGLEEAMQLEGALSLLVDDLQYCNLLDRGFMEVVFTHASVVSKWHFVSAYDSKVYTANSSRVKTLQCGFGEKKLQEINV
ncbi:MAG: alkaline phosphatase D family protein, partial [Sulfurovum sp.]